MIYAFLDANILIRICTQSKPGFEIQWLRELKQLASSGRIRILLPEVVLLELEKGYRGLREQLAQHIGDLKDLLNNKKASWNEIEGVKQEVVNFIDTRKQTKDDEVKEAYAVIRDIDKWDNVVPIPFTVDILFAGKRRQLAGRTADPNKKSESDCYILESLTGFFATAPDKEAALCFCSENHTDFIGELPKAEQMPCLAHSEVAKGLPPRTRCFLDLNSMMAYARGEKPIDEPTEDETTERAKREKARLEAVGTDARALWNVEARPQAVNIQMTDNIRKAIIDALASGDAWPLALYLQRRAAEQMVGDMLGPPQDASERRRTPIQTLEAGGQPKQVLQPEGEPKQRLSPE